MLRASHNAQGEYSEAPEVLVSTVYRLLPMLDTNFAFLTSSQVMVKALIWEKYLENHCPKHLHAVQ